MGKYQKIREIIRNVMKDGKTHTAEEFERLCEKNGIYLQNNRGAIYNVVHQLKQKGEVISDGENGYLLKRCDNVDISSKVLSENTSIDLNEFEIIRPAIRKKTKQVISVFENADISINETLLKTFDDKNIEMRIKKDCGQLLIIPNGEECIEIGKNNKFKNYEIYERLKKRRVKFPVYYVGEWFEDKKYWLGYLTSVNPNKSNFSRDK